MRRIVSVALPKTQTSQSARPALECLLQDRAYRFRAAIVEAQNAFVQVLLDEAILWIFLVVQLVVVMAQPFDLILSPHVELLSQLLEFGFFGLLERAFVESPPQSRCQKAFRVSGSR